MQGKHKTLSNLEVASFCQKIGMIVKAGLPTYCGISILLEESEDDKMKELLTKIYTPMEKGVSLKDALHATGVFPDYMVHMIGLGEETGQLEEVLDSLTVYYQREADIHLGVKHAVTYPLILCFMMLAAIVIIMTQVVPVFAKVYEILDSELTKTAQLFVRISTILNNHLPLLIILFMALVFISWLIYKTPLGKALFQGKGLSISIAQSRFANCMYMVLASGFDTDKGLDISAQLVDNPYMEEKIQKCKSHIKHGENFGNALILSGIFSKVYGSLIAIGQKTGSLPDVMQQIGQSCEEEIDTKLRNFISVLEPVLIIILSIFIGLFMITFLYPLLGILSGFVQ